MAASEFFDPCSGSGAIRVTSGNVDTAAELLELFDKSEPTRYLPFLHN